MVDSTTFQKSGNTVPTYNFEARHMIEALRSGVPSRAVGACFSEARPRIMREISGILEQVSENQRSGGRIISGKYGEGKTHLLNTIFNLAGAGNMVVSYVSLSKETPMDKLYLFYQKVIQNTYLPKRQQPGFMHEVENISANSPVANEMLLYAAKQLETDKLYYLLRSYLNTEDSDEKFILQADMEGDFIANASLKKIYRRIFNQPAKYNVNFVKTRHCADYFKFMSHLFLQMGYHGWIILVDETELMGRLGKKARLNAYKNMANFLLPENCPESTWTFFALAASYTEDVIAGKHEFENLEAIYGEQPELYTPIRTVLNLLNEAPQLAPLTRNEINEVLLKIQDFHGQAYGWTPNLSVDTLARSTQSGGFLLRTKIRAAIEFLDQLYQYGKAGKTSINELGEESFEEDIPEIEDI
ncbi:MAG: ATP-binding protein [Lachnospiraceae bacterium]|nr:ATP-binding protein [Lachnospiraceae bacterium]